MLERDYLVKMLIVFFKAVLKSLQRDKEQNPLEAAELLEAAMGEAIDMDSSVFLSLSPESIAVVLGVTETDPRVMGYVARSLLLESTYLKKANYQEIADLRHAQARAIADAYGIEMPDELPLDLDEETLAAFFETDLSEFGSFSD